MKINEIHLNPDNPRFIKDDRFEKLKNNIKEFPKMMKLRPIIVDDTGKILGGNMRYRAVIELGYSEIPEGWVVKASELTEEEKERFIITDNLPYGDWDYEKLGNEWDEVKLEDWGMDLSEINIHFEPEAEEDDFDVDKAVEDAKEPICKLGDIWQLGKHRIMCGDSTKREDVEKLMDGKKADMVFTDPPYLMGFTGNVHKDGSKSLNAKYGDIENDKLDEAESGIFLSKIALMIKNFCNGAFYICFYRLGIEKIINALLLNGLEYKSLIIWYKNNHNLSNSDYMNIYEPIIYGWNKEHNFYGNRSNFDVITMRKTKQGSPQITTQSKSIYIKQDDNFYKFEKIKIKPKNFMEVKDKVIFNLFTGENNIWEIDKTKANTLHPTMKPIELCEKAIKNSSKVNNNILDLFLGSGSTLIACEQLNRICYGMEIDPIYCDVTIKRWEEYTKQKAEKLNA